MRRDLQAMEREFAAGIPSPRQKPGASARGCYADNSTYPKYTLCVKSLET